MGDPGVRLARAAKFAVAWSARDGRAEILETLLRLGATPTQCDESGRSALLLASMRGRKQCIELLLAAGAWEREPGSKEEVHKWLTHFKLTPESQKSADILQAESLPQPASPRWANTPHGRLAWPLGSAAREKEPEGQGPLEVAITGYGIKEVERIIALGAPLIAEYRLDAQGNDIGTALDLAVVSKRYNLAMQMLSGPEGASLATLSRRAVAWVARDGKTVVLRELLRLGAPAGQCDESGRSALLLAATRGRVECAAALVDAGAWQVEAAASREEVLDWGAKWQMMCFSTCE